MSITVLYVYSPTTFKTSVKLESIAGNLFNSGVVDLLPGVYRLAGGGSVIVTPSSGGVIGDNEIVEHEVVVTNGIKTTYPDPPTRAAQMIGADQLRAFLQGQGEAASF